MPIVSSKLKTGTLTLTPPGDGTAVAVDFSCQATAVRLTPSYEDDGDFLETLCGDTITPNKKETWTIGGTSIQDFDDPLGFQTFCFDNATQLCDFSWCPSTATSPTYTGKCTVVALEIGGDVATRLTTDWEFDVEGKPTVTPNAGSPLAASSARQSEPVPA